MARFGSIGTQYFDDSGRPLSGGSITFYRSGTTTLKDTFSDPEETIPNTNPVVLDSAGRLPDVFFTGNARAVLKNAAGVIIETTDPVGEAVTRIAFSPYSDLITYRENDLVLGIDGLYYRSLADNNTGNQPSISPAWWELFTMIPVDATGAAHLASIDQDLGTTDDVEFHGLTVETLDINDDLSVSGDLSVGGATTLNGLSAKTAVFGEAVGVEGGEITLVKPASGTSFTSDITIDVITNAVRIFAGYGGSTRVATLDFSSVGPNSTLWHSDNDGAGSGLDADLLDGQQATEFGRYATAGTWTSMQTISCTGPFSSVDALRADLDVRSPAGSPSFMQFHRVGEFGAYFGVDTDNRLKWGGWSLGANAYDVWNAHVSPIVSQSEAEAGTGTDPRMWTPERVAQAILARNGGAQVFTASGTWVRPVGVTLVGFVIIGPSGGSGGMTAGGGADEGADGSVGGQTVINSGTTWIRAWSGQPGKKGVLGGTATGGLGGTVDSSGDFAIGAYTAVNGQNGGDGNGVGVPHTSGHGGRSGGGQVGGAAGDVPSNTYAGKQGAGPGAGSSGAGPMRAPASSGAPGSGSGGGAMAHGVMEISADVTVTIGAAGLAGLSGANCPDSPAADGKPGLVILWPIR